MPYVDQEVGKAYRKQWYLSNREDSEWMEARRIRNREYSKRRRQDPTTRKSILEKDRIAAKKRRDRLKTEDPEFHTKKAEAERELYSRPKQGLFARQQGRCALCKRVQSIQKLNLDHNHAIASGLHWRKCPESWRGLLCLKCNQALGWYERVRHLPHLRSPGLEAYLDNPPARIE